MKRNETKKKTRKEKKAKSGTSRSTEKARQKADGNSGLTSIENLHQKTRETFWDRLDAVEKGINGTIIGIALGIENGTYTRNEAYDLVRSSLKEYGANSLFLATIWRKLSQDGDYHGIDGSANSCSCKLGTHERSTYPKLMKKLELLEDTLAKISGLPV